MKWYIPYIGVALLAIPSIAQAKDVPDIAIASANAKISGSSNNSDVQLPKKDASGNVMLTAAAQNGFCSPAERESCLLGCQQEADYWNTMGCHLLCQSTPHSYDCVTTCEMGVYNDLAACELGCCTISA